MTFIKKIQSTKNIFFEEEGDGIIDFSEIDPFTETISNPTN